MSMEPIIKIPGYFINLRNVDFINFYTKEIVFNHAISGSKVTLNCGHISDFKQIIEEQLEKITQNFN